MQLGWLRRAEGEIIVNFVVGFVLDYLMSVDPFIFLKHKKFEKLNQMKTMPRPIFLKVVEI